jgi:hypothetical protein
VVASGEVVRVINVADSSDCCVFCMTSRGVMAVMVMQGSMVMQMQGSIGMSGRNWTEEYLYKVSVDR